MRETIGEALKTALKARDARRTSTLRLLSAAIKDRDIEARATGAGPASDADIIQLLGKMIKQREESFAVYAQAGRNDLATAEKEEIDILKEFTPQMLSEEEVDAAIAAAISSSGAQGQKDMGKVISALKAQYPGRIDMGKASGKVKAALGA
jgi:uncharacterized protein